MQASLAIQKVQRRIPRYHDAPLKKGKAFLKKGAKVFISEDAEGLASSLRQRFLDVGIHATVVSSANEVDPKCDALIFLSALRDYPTTLAAAEMNRVAFEYTKRVSPTFSAPDSTGLLVLVQDTGGYFGFDLGCDPVKAPLGGFAGLAKTANQEWEGATLRSIDLDAGYRNPGVLAEVLFDEIQFGSELEVGLPENGRISIECINEDIEESLKDRTRINANSVILASGGARGVTAACLLELAKESSASFALLGRSPLIDEPAYLVNSHSDAEIKKAILDAAKTAGESVSLKDLGKRSNSIQRSREIRETLALFEKYNSKARYYVSDVTDVENLFTTCEKVREDFGPITALVHGAGVLADKAIKDKSIDDFDWVFRTKVDGFFALSAATAADPLDTICVFSSVAGRFGNVGQADYAMANEVLNKIAWAEKKRREDCVVKSLAWGPWGGGMVTPALQKMFESRGISVIDIDAGAKQFVDEILVEADEIVEVVLGAGLAKKKTKKLSPKVSLNDAPFLKDHAVKSKTILPLVFGIEWMVESASKHFATSDSRIELQDLKVLKGIQLSEKKTNEFELKSTLKADALEMQLIAGAPSYGAKAKQNNVEGTKLRLPKIENWQGKIYDGKILFHGPHFHFLESMSRPDGQQIVAKIGKSKAWTKEYTLDLQGLDAALQVGVIAANAMTTGYVVPTSIFRFQAFSNARASQILGTLVSHDTLSAVYDFHLLDDTGKVLAFLQGCRFQVYEKVK